MMDGNPGENLILIVFYISLVGLVGFVTVLVRINIIDYINKKKSRETQEEDDDRPTISN